jgi:hypothetical protein
MNPIALCGSQLPASITSLSREMSLTFVSDKTGSAQGFQIAYTTSKSKQAAIIPYILSYYFMKWFLGVDEYPNAVKPMENVIWL